MLANFIKQVILDNPTRPQYETLEKQFAWLMFNKALLATRMFHREGKDTSTLLLKVCSTK